MSDPRLPFTDAELDELLKATLHGPLPFETQSRLMATALHFQHERDDARRGFKYEGDMCTQARLDLASARERIVELEQAYAKSYSKLATDGLVAEQRVRADTAETKLADVLEQIRTHAQRLADLGVMSGLADAVPAAFEGEEQQS